MSLFIRAENIVSPSSLRPRSIRSCRRPLYKDTRTHVKYSAQSIIIISHECWLSIGHVLTCSHQHHESIHPLSSGTPLHTLSIVHTCVETPHKIIFLWFPYLHHHIHSPRLYFVTPFPIVHNNATFNYYIDYYRLFLHWPITTDVKACPHCRTKVRLSPNSATVAVVSLFSATVALFCDSVDRALHVTSPNLQIKAMAHANWPTLQR